MAIQPQQLKNGLGPMVETARLSLPKRERPSQDDFYDLCNARFHMLSKRDSFKDHLRGATPTPAEDFAAMCEIMNELLKGAGLKSSLPKISNPFPRPQGGEVIPITGTDQGGTATSRFVSLKVA